MHGVQHLRPLNLKTIADAISMHESTVSRVTANKYMATNRGIFELKYFFTSAIAAADGGEAHSAEAVRAPHQAADRAESVGDVLSDDTIVDKLREAGIDIARRTVAKYREAMRIPSSVQRRREKLAEMACCDFMMFRRAHSRHNRPTASHPDRLTSRIHACPVVRPADPGTDTDQALDTIGVTGRTLRTGGNNAVSRIRQKYRHRRSVARAHQRARARSAGEIFRRRRIPATSRSARRPSASAPNAWCISTPASCCTPTRWRRMPMPAPIRRPNSIEKRLRRYHAPAEGYHAGGAHNGTRRRSDRDSAPSYVIAAPEQEIEEEIADGFNPVIIAESTTALQAAVGQRSGDANWT